MTKLVSLLLLLVAPIACGSACTLPPCPEAYALQIAVSDAATGAPLTTASVRVTGTSVGNISCAGSCNVSGTFGAYELDVSAPGYATVHRSVQVTGTMHDCGCPIVETQHLTITLAAAHEIA